MKVGLFVVLLVVTVSGCTNTVWVRGKQKDGDKYTYEQVGGIPFYTKKEVWDQSTTYSQTWLKASLTVDKKIVNTKEGKFSYFDVDSQTFTRQVAKHRLSDLYIIKEKIMRAGVLQDDEVNDLVKTFHSMAADLTIENIEPDRIGNTLTPKWVVNEKEKYYLNAPMPWFGSGNLTQEIREDGTLSKVISNPDTKLAEGLSSLIPFKEYFTGKYVDPLSDDSDEKVAEALSEVETLTKGLSTQSISEFKPSTKIMYFVSLGIEEIGYLYTFTITHEELTSDIAPIPFNIESGVYTRTALSGNKKDEKPKVKGKTVGLTGSISFPEGWGGSK